MLHWCDTGALLDMIRTKWICPTCKELSPTRHWSVERHIKRKHAGIGEPISINTHQTRIQMNIQSEWSNIHASTNMMKFTHETDKLQRDGSIYRDQSDYTKSDNNTTTSAYQKIYPEKNTILSATASNHDNEKTRRGFPSQHTKNKSVIDDETLQLLHRMAEIKKFSEQNQLRSNLYSTVEVIRQFNGIQLPNELVAACLIHKNIVDNNRNIGYRGRICNKCLSYWIDFAYNNEEEGMKLLMREKFSGHECDPKKVLEISKCNVLDLVSKNNEARRKLSDLFTLIASSIITVYGQKPLYLHIEELIEHDNRQLFSWIKKEDSIDLGNIKEIKESHWAYRAIKEEKVGDKKGIIINSSELVDFFRTALATFGTFRVQMGEDNLPHYFFIYFILN
ncbi:MAG: hypothetical protein ACTHKP_03165 [Nitrososphaeraceae archaeon]